MEEITIKTEKKLSNIIIFEEIVMDRDEAIKCLSSLTMHCYSSFCKIILDDNAIINEAKYLFTKHALEQMERLKNINYPDTPAELKKLCQSGFTMHSKPMNRYSNVYAIDKTRVVIGKSPFNPDGYINANHVGINCNIGCLGKSICGQGPCEGYFEYFWQTVWENKIGVIIVLSDLIEDGYRKVDKYWPDYGKSSIYSVKMQKSPHSLHDYKTSNKTSNKDDQSDQTDNSPPVDYTLETISVEREKGIIVTTIKISCNDQYRLIKHLWYRNWGDYKGLGAEKCQKLFDLYALERQYVVQALEQKLKDIPFIHCSAGIGRTGTYRAITVGIDIMLKGNYPNVCDIVKALKKCRGGMVQTEAQLLTVYLALNIWLKSKSLEDISLLKT